MRRFTQVSLALLASLLVFATSAGAQAQGPDPAIRHMEYNTAWRYRDPYAKREFSLTLANLGSTTFEGARGQQCVCIYVKEASRLGGYTCEYPALRIPFERLAPGEEVVLRGQYFQDIDHGASPARITYRAEIVYDAALAADDSLQNDDINLTNNQAQPDEPVAITLLPRVRK